LRFIPTDLRIELLKVLLREAEEIWVFTAVSRFTEENSEDYFLFRIPPFFIFVLIPATGGWWWQVGGLYC
jgi:hypothetical protein